MTNHFITEYDLKRGEGAFYAVLEDSIMQKGYPVTAGSKHLESFISPFDATVVARVKEAGVTILGKTKMDEFGIAGLFADSEITSSGAVSAVADGVAAFALCNDYTGQIRRQAAQKGLYYLSPSYGRVSRYGLIPAVPSIDQIGIVSKTPADAFRALFIISGYDPKDGLLFPDASWNADEAEGSAQPRIGVAVNALALSKDGPAICELTKGFTAVNFELRHLDVYGQVMQVLCCAELSANLSRYDGIKFGYRTKKYNDLNELYKKSRTESFGPDVKLAALAGAMVLSQENYARWYDKAMRIRREIKESLDFGMYDVIVTPVTGVDSSRDIALNSLALLCGLPSITAPFGQGGLALIADVKCESKLQTALEMLLLK